MYYVRIIKHGTCDYLHNLHYLYYIVYMGTVVKSSKSPLQTMCDKQKDSKLWMIKHSLPHPCLDDWCNREKWDHNYQN